jgi:2-amino-4-hydroxy-6-hydroxymethyldihydropteridine diphosphokinase
MSTAHLLLGSNLGNSEALLTEACRQLALQCGTIVATSAIHTTVAWGPVPQPDYQNQALALETDLDPADLLHACLRIEAELGRRRTVRWGPRTMDIDLLFYDDLMLETEDLQLPHPRLHERLFVLQPLAEIAPEKIHPRFGKTIGELLAALL